MSENFYSFYCTNYTKDDYSSRLKCRHYDLNWRIDNFDFNCKFMKLIKSPKFPSKINPKDGHWFIELKPTEIKAGNNDKFIIFVCCANEINKEEKKFINVKIKIQQYNGYKWLSVQSFVAMNLIQDISKNNNYISWEISGLDLYQRFGNTAAKTIQFICQLRVVDFDTSAVEKSHVDSEKDGLMENIENLLDNEDFKDVTFKIENDKFTAHKNILAIRSPVFAAMFKNKMTEELTSVVEIDDIKPKLFQQMLYFIYTDRVENFNESALELLYVAEKYQVEKLKTMCIENLNANLSLQTVIKTFQVADLYSVEKLKNKCLRIMNKEIDTIIETDEFRELILSRPYLWLHILKIERTSNHEEADDSDCYTNWSYEFRTFEKHST